MAGGWSTGPMRSSEGSRLLQLEKKTTGEGTKKTEADTSQQCMGDR